MDIINNENAIVIKLICNYDPENLSINTLAPSFSLPEKSYF